MHSCGDVLHYIPSIFFNDDTQAIIFAGLCVVGAWVVFSWLVKVWMKCVCKTHYPPPTTDVIVECFQVFLSVLWPLTLFAFVMAIAPNLKKSVMTEFVPKQIDTLKVWMTKLPNAAK